MSTPNNSDPELSLAKIGGKWKIPILWRLGQHDAWRYSALKKDLGSISHAVLSRQLDELEKDELILRTVYPVVPPKTEYALTEQGRATIPVIDALCDMNTVLDPAIDCTCVKCTQRTT